jgi:hypothetical protein
MNNAVATDGQDWWQGGGGVYVDGGALTLTNSTISGNTASGWHGSAIFHTDGEMIITNSTIANNIAPDWGSSAIFIGEYGSVTAKLSLTKTIITGNHWYACEKFASGGPVSVVSGGHNVVQDDSCNPVSTNKVIGDAVIGPLANNGGPTWTHALLPGSPGIDAGDDAACPATDQRGVTRPRVLTVILVPTKHSKTLFVDRKRQFVSLREATLPLEGTNITRKERKRGSIVDRNHFLVNGVVSMTNQQYAPIFIGDRIQHLPQQRIEGEFVNMQGEMYYRIKNYDAMRPFFMSNVSSSDHWLFISSTGGLTAGRVSAEQALFPYYTEDKLSENHENTGAKTILRVTRGERTNVWEPFSNRLQGSYSVQRNLYKNIPGTAILFEEINHDLGLTYRYAWRTSDEYGFVKTSWLINTDSSSCQVDLIDGIQNLLPAQITSSTQNIFSPLLDAYKRSELDPETGLAIFALNSTLTDLAEPSESLLATTVMQIGLETRGYLISSAQLDCFRRGGDVCTETEVRGQRCAYFVRAALDLVPGETCVWHLVADVSQDSGQIVQRTNQLRRKRAGLQSSLESDIALNTASLEKIVIAADGWQASADRLCTTHHFANVMFNTMRGGIFASQYLVQTQDFIDFVSVRNREVLSQHQEFFSSLPPHTDILNLQSRASTNGSQDLIRLVYAYLPLSFSRRHGDPSRPWNRFAIELKKEDGSLKLGYEGNWRDIFQNWEALAWSYPEYVESMICTFINATTADGYNPYRISREGIDWETPEPNNPWANIGYWSDHQIIYLQKLMEISARMHPGRIQTFLSQPVFSHANVPYRLKRYTELLRDPFNTIEFDWELQAKIEDRVKHLGSDGKLALSPDGQVLHTTLAEKLLILVLAKLVNLVPEGGLWMNTQRPEWNDANNALVGKGLSVVTLCYLRRTLVFYKELLKQTDLDTVQLSQRVAEFYSQISRILNNFKEILKGSFSDMQRRAIMDALGQAGSDYRWQYYSKGVSGAITDITGMELVAFLDLAQEYVEHTIRANRRSDNLYHAYNVLHLDHERASISRLDEMLEGQVAVLSSEMLTGEESLRLLESLRRSRLYRADQHSYILYPDRTLPGFLQKNTLTPEQIEDLSLVKKLVEAGDTSLIVRDEDGNYHFSGRIHNMKDVNRVLTALRKQPDYADLVVRESGRIAVLFEDIFHHTQFTGRSGTFFAYEGLGSIYWHMVSKLLLAVQETILRTKDESATPALVEKYFDIRKGLSYNKSPEEYGAFPTDPYSHTPKSQGARQPGMSGMVKEEILTRQKELGFFVSEGRVSFVFLFFDKKEFLTEPLAFEYWNVAGEHEQIVLPARTIAYTVCQVPIVLESSDEMCIDIHFADGVIQRVDGHDLDLENSKHIFERDGVIHHLVVSCR